MSIDYSDMAFPKPGKKKKRKIHKKSILNSQKGICYLCARLNGDYSVKQTEEHHILFGAGQRAISEEKPENRSIFYKRRHMDIQKRRRDAGEN